MLSKLFNLFFFCARVAFKLPVYLLRKLLPTLKVSAESNINKEIMDANMTTEVKCSEQSKGGLKYELVLSAPSVDSPKHTATNSGRSSLSRQDIEEKLKAAEERRQSVELQKLCFVTGKLNQLEVAKEKREEFNHNFIQSAKENLEQKYELMKENRDTHIKNIQEKAREVVHKVDEKRKNSDSPDREEKLEAIIKKVMTAREQRENNLNNLKERLKEHDRHIAEVKKQMDEQTENLREKSIKKLEVAQAKRESILKEIQEKIKEHQSHILKVRESNEQSLGENKMIQQNQIQQKLSNAKLNRSVHLDAMIGKLQQHERHIEVVRQKAMSGENGHGKENLSG